MRKPAILLVTALAVIVMLLAIGCSSEESPTPTSTPTLEPTPVATSTPTAAPTVATPTPVPTPVPTLDPSNTMPNRFYGQAKLDGVDVADGTVITAIIEGVAYEGTIPAEGYEAPWYAILVVEPKGKDYTGKTVTFRIGNYDADQTATWEQGANTKLNLTASTSP